MRRLVITAAAAAIVLAGAGFGIAYASIPDSSGVIHACYKTPVPSHGEPLQIIDSEAGGTCAKGFLPVTWNRTGPQGPTGPQGATGAQGPQGPQGPPGPGGGTPTDYGELLLQGCNDVTGCVCTLSHLGGPDAATMTASTTTRLGVSGCEISGISLSDMPLVFVTENNNPYTQFQSFQTTDDGGGSFTLVALDANNAVASFMLVP
jgi:hypothetical protein